MKRFAWILLLATLLSLSSCSSSDKKNGTAVYVKPSVDYRGRYRKGHVRFKTSSKPNAIKSQNRSRYYYKTRGKYRKR